MKEHSFKLQFAVLLVLLLGFLAAAAITGRWVLSAVPIGIAFGFCLHRGDLCTSAACSEVILFRDPSKMLGVWTAIITSMAGFALLDALGWIALAPPGFYWLNNILGGVLFGIGMVLAGGCVSGCLYKASAGNLNAMAGIAGILAGAFIAESGPFIALRDRLMASLIQGSKGETLTCSGLLGLSYGMVAILLVLITLIASVSFLRNKSKARYAASRESLARRILFKPWKPWQAGLAIGVLAILAYPSSSASGRNYPLGVTSGVIQTRWLLLDDEVLHISDREDLAEHEEREAQGKPVKKVEWWEVLLVLSLLFGAWTSGRLSGARLLPKPWSQIVIAFIGGILLACGVALGLGCTIGHIFSGWALQSAGSFLFALSMVISNWITTYLYLMGPAAWKRSQ
jgi:uncharacterized membrane protein YedE/YeeE